MEVFSSGDLPWLRLILGITTAYQVLSIYTNATLSDKEWVDIGSIRTQVTDAQHFGLLPVFAAGKGVAYPPPLILPHTNIVLCMLHLWMAFGRLLAHFIVTRMIVPSFHQTFELRSKVSIACFVILQKHEKEKEEKKKEKEKVPAVPTATQLAQAGPCAPKGARYANRSSKLELGTLEEQGVFVPCAGQE